jgi:hypothetical protein
MALSIPTCFLIAADPAHSHPSWQEFSASTWIVVTLAALGVAWVIWKAVMYSVDPGEEGSDHIKRMILQEPETPEGLRVLEAQQAGATSADADAAGRTGA